MKKLALFVSLIVLSIAGFSQTKGYLKYDSLYIQRDGGGNAEVVLQNSSRGNTGAFLQNTGNGRTKFAFAFDTAYWNATLDTLILHRGDRAFKFGIPKFDSTSLSNRVNAKLNSADTTGKWIWKGNLSSGYIPVAGSNGQLVNSYLQQTNDGSGNYSILLPSATSQTNGPSVGSIYYNLSAGRIYYRYPSGWDGLLRYSELYSWDNYLNVPAYGTPALAGLGALRYNAATDHLEMHRGSPLGYYPVAMEGLQFSLPIYHYNNATDPNNVTPASGMVYYNTTTNKFRGYLSGAWDNFASESWVSGQIRTGNYIYVDANNPNATDTRGVLSKYSLTTPFKTIQAAVNASLYTDVVYVRAGTYTENVSVSPNNSVSSVSSIFILDNCTLNGGTGDALTVNGAGAYGISLYMINATIKSTGGGSGIWAPTAVNTIFGNSSATCFISSNTGYGYKGFSSTIKAYNVSITSTSGFGYADVGGGAGTQYFNLCALTSTSGTAVQSNSGLLTLDQCNVTASSMAFDGGSGCNVTITNSILTSNSGSTIGASSFFVGGSTPVNVTVYNSQLTGFTSIFNLPFATGPINVTYSATNNKYNVTSGTSVFTISTSGHTTWLGSGSLIKVANSISNQPIFTSSDRTTYGFAFKESNTNTTNTIYYGINVGFGEANPQYPVDVVGAIRVQGQATDPTGANGTINYNTTTNKFRGYRNGAFTDFYMKGDVNGGTIIWVDKNNPNATDNRTGISKYSYDVPFLTVQAAANVLNGTTDVLQVMSGTYNEVVTLPSLQSASHSILLYNAHITRLNFGSTNNQAANIQGYGSSAAIDSIGSCSGCGTFPAITARAITLKWVSSSISSSSNWYDLTINTLSTTDLWGGNYYRCNITCAGNVTSTFYSFAAGFLFKDCSITASGYFTPTTGGLASGGSPTYTIDHCNISVTGNMFSTRGGNFYIKNSYFSFNGYFCNNDGGVLSLKMHDCYLFNGSSTTNIFTGTGTTTVEYGNVIRNTNNVGTPTTLNTFGYDTYTTNATYF